MPRRMVSDMDRVFWAYMGIIGLMEANPATYGMEQHRTNLHNELEGYFPGKEEELKYVLHNLPDYAILPGDLKRLVRERYVATHQTQEATGPKEGE